MEESLTHNHWSPGFATRRNPSGDPYVYSFAGESGLACGPLKAFFQANGKAPCTQDDEIQEFCGPIQAPIQKILGDFKDKRPRNTRHRNDVEPKLITTNENPFVYPETARQLLLSICTDGSNYQEPNAWLHDRQTPESDTEKGFVPILRKNDLQLTPLKLHSALVKPRVGHSNEPNADRRLLHIEDLNPYFILVLAMTAPHDHVIPLRNAIWRHLAWKTALRVIISSGGFASYTLELNLPYLALRRYRSPPSWTSTSNRPRRRFHNLKSFNLFGLHTSKDDICGAIERHSSITITGSSNQQYTCYGFFDKRDPQEIEEKLEEDDDDETEETEEEDDDGENDEETGEEEDIEDLIASIGHAQEEYVLANGDLNDARSYFLQILYCRSKQVCLEWQYLIRKIERGIENWKDDHPFGFSTDPEKAISWYTEAIRFLEVMGACLSNTTEVWIRFDSPTGSIGCFSGLQKGDQERIRHIRGTFGDMIDLNNELTQIRLQLRNFCEGAAQMLHLHLTYENKRVSITNQILTRDALNLNRRTFDLNAVASDLNHNTNEVAQKNHGLSLITFMMSQLYVPIALAIAFFGSEREILPFARTPRNFFGAVLVMFILANAVVAVIFVAGRSTRVRNTLKRLNRVLLHTKNTEDQITP